MRIILSNYRYFNSGGPERYLFNIKAVLENFRNDVIPFSVRSSKNEKSEYEKYFMSPIGDDESIYFKDYNKNPLTIAKFLARQFYSPEGFFKARRLAKKTKADIVYSLHFLNKMSPSIIDGFKSAGLPVVVRISDFGIICPQDHLFSNGKICERCISGGLGHSIASRCVKNSIIGSMIKAFAYNLHRHAGCLDRVDAWVFPSNFTRQKYIEAGMDEEKLFYVPTFIDSSTIAPEYQFQNYLLYFGRITEEKGVHTLLDAYSRLRKDGIKLKVIGEKNDTAYSRKLVSRYSDAVEFLGFMNKPELNNYIRKAIAVVVPSVWYDNLPNVVLESFAHGKPVIAPNHGCFPEVISNLDTGILFEPNDADGLKDALEHSLLNLPSMQRMGKLARDYVETAHSPKKHYEKLMDLFATLIDKS